MFIESEDLEEEINERKAPQISEEEHQKRKKEKAEKNKNAWDLLKTANGVFVPGGFGFRGSHGKISAIRYARENKIPFFGICYGFQLAVVEFCQNVLKWNAISEENVDEYAKSDDLKKVIAFMPEINKDFMGGTMRLGRKRILIE